MGVTSINPVPITNGTDYAVVAASQTDSAIGPLATGTYLAGVLILPDTVAAGAVSIKDGDGSSITLWPGGAVTPLLGLIPFFVPFGALSVRQTTPGWKLTTGANVRAIAFGQFS